ncbi:hypothetical protein BDV19DRAFT_391245 [Aspergillus venezuelensis]
MPRIVTEIANVSFVPEANIDETLSQAVAIISRQPGLRSLKWGRWEEDPNRVQMMHIWEDISSHTSFMQSIDYPSLISLFDDILTGEPAIIHVYFDGDDTKINKILADPLVELATFFGPRDDFEVAVTNTLNVGTASEGCLDYVRGEVVEEIAATEDGVKEKAQYLAISWTSLEDRVAATKRPEVQESGLRVVQSIGGLEVHHVKFK